MAFPDTVLDLQAELLIAGTWASATSKVYQREGAAPPAVITRGRPDESGQANPSSAVFEVNNRDGRFSPANPLGPWYGSLGRNTPARLSIPAQSNYLRLEAEDSDRAYVQDTAALRITGSIEMRIQLALSDWQGCILAQKWDGGGAWYWGLNPDGTLIFAWDDGSVAFHTVTSSVPLPFARGSRALRVTMDATTGTVTYYTAASIDGAYSQLGSALSGTGGAATSILAATGSALVVGFSFNSQSFTPPVARMCGGVQEYRLYDGIGGTVVADGVFSAQAAGTTTWTDSAGRTWLLGGSAEISARDYRFHGEIASLPPRWDVTGADQSVQVTASGPLRRLGQGQSPAQSPLRRALTSLTGTLVPVAYWPWEDGRGASALGSAIGGPLMQFDGSPTLATDSSFAASAPLPQLNGARFYGSVPAYSGSGSIVVRFLMKLGTAPPSTTTLVRLLTTGTVPVIDLQVTSAGFLQVASSGGVLAIGALASPIGASSWAGQQWWMSMEVRPSGGNVQMTLVMLYPGSGQAYASSTASTAGSVGNISQVRVNPSGLFADTVMGHFSAQSDWETMFNFQDPMDAWAGETAAARFARLCGENGLACRIIGSPGQSAAMGQQGIATPQALLQECEAADRGLMFEPRQALALGYRTLASMCNQAPRVTLDYSAGQLGGTTGGDSTGLEPTYDDQRLRNDETVTRGSTGGSGSQGAVYQYQLDDGSPLSVGVAGDYSDSQTVNVESDSQVPNVAGWLVHLGTVNEARWPVIPFNLRRGAIQSAGLYYPLLNTDIGDYVLVSNLPQVIAYDSVKQLAFGLRESLGGYHHALEVNAVPESPYEVIILDDPVYGRVDTDGCQLRAAAASGATTLAVASTGPPWTTAAADMPFDVAIGGERVTVTAVGNGPSGALTSPAAFASLATCSLPPGTWLIGWTVQLSGTVGANELNNVRLTDSSGALIATAVLPAAAGTYPQAAALVTISGSLTGAVLKVGANAGTSGAVYTATFTSPQALTVTRSVNGVVKAQAAGTDVRLWFPPVLALT